MQSLVSHWGYLALFLITALSAFGVPIGSELAMVYGGALASGQVLSGREHFELGLVILIALLGELVGSLAGYGLGRFGGRPLVDKVGRYLLLTHRDLKRVEAYLARSGESFVLVGRLVPLLRSFVSIVAGLAQMALWRFLVFSLIGSAIFTAALAGLGYALGGTWHSAVTDFSAVGYLAVAVALVAIVIGAVHRLGVFESGRRGVAQRRKDEDQASSN